MRFLFVIDSFVAGGAQRQLVSLALEMVARNHTVEFFIYHKVDHLKHLLTQAGIKIHYVNKKWRFSIKPAWAIRKLCKKNNYSLVLSFLTTPNFYSLFSQLFVRNKKPVVVSERSNFNLATRSFVSKNALKFYGLASHITFNSFHARESFIQDMSWDAEKVSTIWNGLDLDFFKYQDIGQCHQTHQFLAVGHLKPKKEWINLLQAMAILKKEKNLSIKVNWVGRLQGISEVEVDYYQQMKDTIKELELENQWNWVGLCTDMTKMYSEHIALIHPSTLEGLPNVVCESLACGRPVIASDMLDHPRLVQNRKTGYLFEPYSATSLADAIYELCCLDKAQLCDMSNNAREFAENNLAIKTLADRYEKLFTELIQNGKAANQ